MYYFIHWQQRLDTNEYEPDIPEGIDYQVLAGPCFPVSYGVFQCWVNDDAQLSPLLTPVSRHLATLLDSAQRYPPALALARKQLPIILKRHYLTMQDISYNLFTDLLANLLQTHLQEQSSARYFLVEATTTELGYLARGGYYWAVAYNPETERVAWVSDDYWIYENPVSHFRIDHGLIAQLRQKV